MNATIHSWFSFIPFIGIFELLADISIKATLVCTLAALSTLVLRRSSAHARNTVWVLALAVLLLLPITSAMSPLWRLPLLPGIGDWDRRIKAEVPVLASSGNGFDLEEGPVFVGPPTPALVRTGFGSDWRAWVFIVWTAGALACLGWYWAGTRAGGRILARAAAAGEEWRSPLREMSAEIGIRRRVRLFESGEIKAAVTIGVLNPVIVVPAGSMDWSAEKRRFVLSHELAHVKRRDGLIEAVAYIVTSIHWFNPYVWWALKRLRIERERDCDDAVLNSGANPPDYAMLLMEVARELCEPPRPVWRLSTISQGSNLKDRIMCILDPKINRNRKRGRRAVIGCILFALLVVPLSTSGIWETRAEHKSKKKSKELKLEEEKLKQLQLEEKKKKAEEMVKEKQQSVQEKIEISWQKISTKKNSAAVAIFDALEKEGPGAIEDTYKKLKLAGSGKYYFDEHEFNTLGYYMLYGGKTKEAIAVFSINTEVYPESWNVYDSLGEACLAGGSLECAKKNYKKSLELNPDNENGKKALAEIAKKNAI